MNWKKFLIGLALSVITLPALAYDQAWDQGHDDTINTGDQNENVGPQTNPSTDCNATSGSPVYLQTGEFVWSEVDISLTGRLPLLLHRTFNSHDPRIGLFGAGWISGCEEALLYFENEDEFILRMANGQRLTYSGSNGGYQTPKGRNDRLTIQGDGKIRITFLDGSYLLFSAKGSNGNLFRRVDNNGNALVYQYNGQSRLTKISNGTGYELNFQYNSAGQVSQVSDHINRTWKYSYNNKLWLVSVTNPAGGVRRYEYQQAGPTSNYVQLTKVTDESGVVETQVIYDGRRVKSYTEGANTFTYDYSRLNSTNPYVRKTGAGYEDWYYYLDVDGLKNRVSYDGVNFYIKRDEYNLPSQVKDEYDNTTQYTRDNRQRVTSIINALGQVTRFTYDGASDRVATITTPMGRVTSFTYDSKGNLKTQTGSDGLTWTYSYNGKGDLIQINDPAGNISKISRNAIGLPTAIEDADGRKTTFGYNAVGLLTLVTDGGGNSTRYNYDALDRLTKITDARNTATNLNYDAVGRIKQLNNAGSIWTFEYDAYGRQTKRISPSGSAWETRWSERNLPSSIKLPSGGSYSLGFRGGTRLPSQVGSTYYWYDNAGRLTQSRQDSRQNYILDALGRITKITLSDGSDFDDDAIDITYNADSQITSFTHNGNKVDYQYFANGRLKNIVDNAVNKSWGFGYDNRGLLNTFSRPGANASTYSYDKSGMISRMVYPGVGNITLSRNARGLISSRSGMGYNQTFGYDALGQLAAVQGTNAATYNYDARQNRLGNGRVYDIANQLTEDSQFQYTYDDTGRLTKKTRKSDGVYWDFSWRDPGTLRSIRRYETGQSYSQSEVVVFSYDANNRLTYLSENTGYYAGSPDKSFLWFGNNIIAENKGSDDQRNRRYIYAGQFTPSAVVDNNQLYHVYTDHLGTPLQIRNTSNTTVWRATYDNWGKRTLQTETLKDFDFQLPGQLTDVLGSGISYNRYRFYDTHSGRYISNDPLGFLGGTNLYNYAYNNPNNYLDPTGQLPVIPIIVGIGAWFGLEVLYWPDVPYDSGIALPTTSPLDALGGLGFRSAATSAPRAVCPVTKRGVPGSYRPDRALPRDKHGNPVPDTNAPHTQLGTKKGRNGDYTQAREFDANGKPVRDIDFTDHGRPQNHPNPHQHRYVPNETGGTPRRLKTPEPL